MRDVAEVAEKVYHNKESKDEKKILNRDLAKVLMANNTLEQSIIERESTSCGVSLKGRSIKEAINQH